MSSRGFNSVPGSSPRERIVKAPLRGDGIQEMCTAGTATTKRGQHAVMVQGCQVEIVRVCETASLIGIGFMGSIVHNREGHAMVSGRYILRIR